MYFSPFCMRNKSPKLTSSNHVYAIWDEVFKNGPSKICRRQPLKYLSDMVCLIFKGCLPQTLLGLFLNTLSHSHFPMDI